MDIGICVASHIGDIDYVVRAEELGYSHAWFADSQMIWSDCYASLALAADRTSRIRLGTGVAVTGVRPAPVTAASIATINALAPGRTFLGVGTGNTARRIMGQKPQRIAEYERYLTELKGLLRGEETAHLHEGQEQLIRHIMPDLGFVNFNDPIPLYVSGFAPRSLALAGKYGDGAVVGAARSSSVTSLWHMVQAGAREAERQLVPGENYYTTALTAMVVLDDGEAVDSDRVKSECGAMATAALHYSYEGHRNFGQPPPPYLANVWDDYVKLLDAVPEERRHQRIHAGHNCWVVEEEERFLTPEVLDAVCLIGTRDQLLEHLSELGRSGLNQVMILPSFAPRYQVIERVARDIIPNL